MAAAARRAAGVRAPPGTRGAFPAFLAFTGGMPRRTLPPSLQRARPAAVMRSSGYSPSSTTSSCPCTTSWSTHQRTAGSPESARMPKTRRDSWPLRAVRSSDFPRRSFTT